MKDFKTSYRDWEFLIILLYLASEILSEIGNSPWILFLSNITTVQFSKGKISFMAKIPPGLLQSSVLTELSVRIFWIVSNKKLLLFRIELDALESYLMNNLAVASWLNVLIPFIQYQSEAHDLFIVTLLPRLLGMITFVLLMSNVHFAHAAIHVKWTKWCNLFLVSSPVI